MSRGRTANAGSGRRGGAAGRSPIAMLSAVTLAVMPIGASIGSPAKAATVSHSQGATPAPAPHGQEGDPASRSVAARTRMLECGHQWSAMKKAGTAAGTWKEFSRGCLAQR